MVVGCRGATFYSGFLALGFFLELMLCGLSDATLSMYRIPIHVIDNGPIAPLQDLLDFTIQKAQLPDKWVRCRYAENLEHSEYGMNAMFLKTSTARALDLRTNHYLELLLPFVFKRKHRWPIFSN